jgi:hypothetical protein
MATIVEKRNYNMTDAELCMFTSNLCITLQRDILSLAPFGISLAKINSLKAIGDAFEVFPSDEVLVAYIIGTTEAKNAKAEEVKESIRNMIMRCQMKWGNGSWQERALTVTGMSEFTDEQLLFAAKRVHAQMTEFLPELGDTGLSQDILDDMADLNQAFEDAKNTQVSKIAERDKKARERIANGNEIYSYVSSYCDIGKRVFEKTDPAAYNAYIIYTTQSPGSLIAPVNLSYNAAAKVISWSVVINATSYQVMHKATGPIENWAVIYSGSDTTHYRTDSAGNWAVKVRARNDGGFGDWSSVFDYVVSNTPQV